MKSSLFKTSLSLLLLLVASFSFCQQAEDISFDKKIQKFSKVEEGHQITLSYKFSYSGEFPLSIVPPVVDCSCTEVILPNEPIKPNSSNVIVIKFDTNGKIGYQERAVSLKFTSDMMDSRSIVKKITFKGVVKASKSTKETYKKSK